MKTLSTTAISILDLAKVASGNSIAETFAHSRELVKRAEEWGYTRYWLAEHHNIEGIASAATAVLIGHLAEHSKKIRIGSGGIMLPNHAPLIIAEQFGTLASLYPDRIDLGLGRAPGSDQTTMRAIRRDLSQGRPPFDLLIEELLFYFKKAEPFQKVRAIPGAGIDVPIYILGSSHYSAELAAKLGRPYAFAGHFAPAAMISAFEIYRSNFQPSEVLDAPYVMAGVPVIAADTDERAQYLATSVQQAFLGMIRGQRKLSLPPVENMDLIWNEREKEAVHSMLGMLVAGNPQTVTDNLDAFIQLTGADELIITSDTFDHADRLKSYHLIAQAKNSKS